MTKKDPTPKPQPPRASTCNAIATQSSNRDTADRVCGVGSAEIKELRHGINGGEGGVKISLDIGFRFCYAF